MGNDAQILFLFGAALPAIFFIIVFIMIYQKRRYQYLREKQELQHNLQREILKTQLETQEENFHKIGEQLHDNIGQLLSSTRMLLGITERNLPEIPDTFRTADETLAKAIQDLRLLSRSLNKEWLNQFNLLEHLQAEADRVNAAGVIRIGLESSIKNLPLNPQSQVMLFRIVQEAVDNSIKHAQATGITISVEVVNEITISVQDDGKGFSVQEHDRTGAGLINMKNRTHLLGGNIAWKSAVGAGTEVSIQIPAQHDTNEN